MTTETNAVKGDVKGAGSPEEREYPRSPWTKKLDEALEQLASAHLAIEELHREVSAYRDDFDPEADDAAGADFALLEEAADAVEALKDRLDMSEINGDLDLDEDKVKETFDRLTEERGAGAE